MTDNPASHDSQESDFSPIIGHPKCGFNTAHLEEFNPRFKCIFCFLIINNPIQLTECGHRACFDCFQSRAGQSPDGNVTCPVDDCHIITNKNQIMHDKAFKRELNTLSITCIHQTDRNCQWIGFLKDYQQHLDENHVHHICEACRGSFSTKTALDEHVRRCPSIYNQCRFGAYCSEEMIVKDDFLNHLHSEKHQDAVNKFLLKEYHLPESTNSEVENQISTQVDEQLSLRLNTLTEELRQLNENIVETNSSFDNLSQHFNNVTQDVKNVYLINHETHSIKQISQPNQEQIQKDIEQLEEICESSQYIPVDGTLTWRIDNLAEKMADAQSERQTSIYSPIFYSSPIGYKMRARLFLFGDGNARRTHISLFFLLMRGEYDAVLKWPFHYKVTFCLLDQSGNNNHKIDSFYPDVKSNSFQRPKEAANTASGIPKFAPLTMLLQDDNPYVRENTLYLKIIIALNETAKSIIPFTLTLNPALPNYVQENLIEQEIAKQQSNIATS